MTKCDLCGRNLNSFHSYCWNLVFFDLKYEWIDVCIECDLSLHEQMDLIIEEIKEKAK